MRMKRRDYLKLAAGLPAIATSNAMAMSAEISAGKPKEIVNFSADVPVKYNVDVFVAGGGPAGIAAMVAAAESGAASMRRRRFLASAEWGLRHWFRFSCK